MTVVEKIPAGRMSETFYRHEIISGISAGSISMVVITQLLRWKCGCLRDRLAVKRPSVAEYSDPSVSYLHCHRKLRHETVTVSEAVISRISILTTREV